MDVHVLRTALPSADSSIRIHEIPDTSWTMRGYPRVGGEEQRTMSALIRETRAESTVKCRVSQLSCAKEQAAVQATESRKTKRKEKCVVRRHLERDHDEKDHPFVLAQSVLDETEASSDQQDHAEQHHALCEVYLVVRETVGA